MISNIRSNTFEGYAVKTIVFGKVAIPLWFIVVLLISGIGVVVLAKYLWPSVIIPVEVKEPLEILDYSPLEFSLFPGETENITVTVQNHAPVNYSAILDFQLNDTKYQNKYVKFNDGLHIIVPGQQELTAWLTISASAPATHVSLTVTLKRVGEFLTEALLIDDFEACNLNAWSGDKSFHSCSDEQARDGSYSLKGFTTYGSYSVHSIYRSFEAKTKIKADFYFWIIDFVSHPLCMSVSDGSGNTAFDLRIEEIGSKLAYYDGSFRDICTVNAGQWYHIEVELDASSDTFDLWVDSTKYVTGGSFRQSVSDFSRVNFHVQTGSCQSRYYADSVIITDLT